jgi:hypothetical protein
MKTFLASLASQTTPPSVCCFEMGNSFCRISTVPHTRNLKSCLHVLNIFHPSSKLRDFSPQANYTDRATAAFRRS